MTTSKAVSTDPRPFEVALKLLSDPMNHRVELFLPLSPSRTLSNESIGFLRVDPFILNALVNSACKRKGAGSHVLETTYSWSETSPQGSSRNTWDTKVTNLAFCLKAQKTGNLSGSMTPMVDFYKLAKVLASKRTGIYTPFDSVFCTWYGGALLYADTGMDKLIRDVCARRPDIAALQLEFDMRDHITQGFTESTLNAAFPKRSRMKL